MSYTGSHLNNQRDQSERNLPQRAFFPSTVFHHDVGDRVRAEACKKTTLKQVTDIEEEWNDSTYTNCELKWKDKGKIQNIKVVTVRGGMHFSCSSPGIKYLCKVGPHSAAQHYVQLVFNEETSNCHSAHLLSGLQLQCFLYNTFIYCRKKENK